MGASPSSPAGLSEREVVERRTHGQGNRVSPANSRSYWQIIAENMFTFINIVLFTLGLILALLGQFMDALVSVGVILLNILVSVVQEIRAKRTLDRITVLTQPTAHVIREAREYDVPPQDLVVGDVLHVGPGDQIVLDGTILSDPSNGISRSATVVMAVDESLLTGESDIVPKRAGDPVYSGSFCASGTGYYVAEKVGSQSLANSVMAGARSFRRVLTPLQEQINFVIRLALLIALYLEFLLVLDSIVRRIDLVQGVQNATIIAGLVPNGLFLSIALAYAIAAVRIVRYGALVQQANAIESLSHVDVLCLDKTGTLTANRLQVVETLGLTENPDSLKQLLGIIVASTHDHNKTSEAIATAFPAEAHSVIAEVPFSSSRKWSAAAFDERPDSPTARSVALRGVYVLGAPEILRPFLDSCVSWETITTVIRDRAQQGLRVLLVAHSPVAEDLQVGAPERLYEDARLPVGLTPLGLVVLSDELRPEARETLRSFLAMGLQPKIISGDHPETVAALARQAGLDNAALRVVSGAELDALDDVALAEIAEDSTIFGRTTPQHKERLIRALRSRGHYVAMVGDGVNDVLSLKQAQLAIAMHSGSQAARSVSDMVLMQDSFATLVPAMQEGQRVVNGMQDILKIILARVTAIGLLVVSSLALGPLPLALRQGSLITLLAVGIPTVLLAIWAHPQRASRADLRRQLLHFVSAAAIVTAALGLLLFYGVIAIDHGGAASPTAGFVTAQPTPLDIFALTHAQTAVSAFLVFSGLLLVVFVEPPTPWWTGGDRLSGDWRPTVLAGALAMVFVMVELAPPLRDTFALAPLTLVEWGLVSAATLLWLPLLRWIWRTESVARYLGMNPLDDAIRGMGHRKGRNQHGE